MEFDWVNKYDNFNLLNDNNKDDAVNALLSMTNEDKVKTLLSGGVRPRFVKDVGVETLSPEEIKSLLRNDRRPITDTERVKSVQNDERDYQWSWYGYSRGYVQDGYIRSDDTLVVKERFVGCSSFLFNHTDYTQLEASDYIKNMNPKHGDENLMRHNHDLKINHTPSHSREHRMQNPDMFLTNISIKPIGFVDSYNERDSGIAVNQRYRGENCRSPIGKVEVNGDPNKVETEYVDEINVTILREDISIEEHVMLNSVRKKKEKLNRTPIKTIIIDDIGNNNNESMIVDELSNSYDDISCETIHAYSNGINRRINFESERQTNLSDIRISDVYLANASGDMRRNLNGRSSAKHYQNQHIGDSYSVDDYVIIDMQDNGMSWRDETASGIFIEVT